MAYGPDAEVAADALESVLARLAVLDHGSMEDIRAYRMRRMDLAED